MTDLLTPEDLARRWGYEVRTLANQRHAKVGPPYIRLGGNKYIRYRLSDVEAYENARLVKTTPKSPSIGK